MIESRKLKRVHAGRYEDGTYGIRKIGLSRNREARTWQTFRLTNEGNYDGGWIQSYHTLAEAKKGLVASHEEDKAPQTMPDFDEVFGKPGVKVYQG